MSKYVEAPTLNPLQSTKGRGASSNDESRFLALQSEVDLSQYGWFDEEDVRTLKTKFYTDSTKTILTQNDSPDIPFQYSVNAYRGCEHGCIYCYARPTHEYLGLSAGLDFESKIFVKEKAPELLREKLMSKSWTGDSITMSGVTDCYQPCERFFKLTRGCLEVLAEFKNPVSLITKNNLITRDIDVLKELASVSGTAVMISMTTLDQDIWKNLEPRTSAPQSRLNAIAKLHEAGIPVGVNLAPIIPGLTDSEIPALLKEAREAGAQFAGYTMLRLPYSVKKLFQEWLKVNFPDRAEKVLHAIESVRNGKLNNAEFSTRLRGTGPRADQVAQMFRVFKRKYNYGIFPILTSEHFKKPAAQQAQMSLFDLL